MKEIRGKSNLPPDLSKKKSNNICSAQNAEHLKSVQFGTLKTNQSLSEFFDEDCEIVNIFAGTPFLVGRCKKTFRKNV